MKDVRIILENVRVDHLIFKILNFISGSLLGGIIFGMLTKSTTRPMQENAAYSSINTFYITLFSLVLLNDSN